MFRIRVLGKIGYFKKMDEAIDWAWKEFQKYSIDDILQDLNYSVEEIKQDFLAIKNFDSKKVIRKFHFVNYYKEGKRVANYFCWFRLKLRAKGKNNFADIFTDKDRFRKILKSYFQLNRTNNLDRLRALVNIANIRHNTQEVANFIPTIAKAIYEYYCPIQNAKILDWSAGFGGRLVGAMSSKYNYFYYGIDPATETMNALKKLTKFLNVEDRVVLIQKPFEDCDKDLKDNYFDFAFTSPPYFNKEEYSDEPTQAFKRYPEFEIWKEKFLFKSMQILYKKLKPNTLNAVNIANIKEGNKVLDLEGALKDCAKRAGFKYIGFKRMLVSSRKMSYKKQRREKVIHGRGKEESEKIFIFKKV
jgi:16S rRNA G966 N2-methylase RsmD